MVLFSISTRVGASNHQIPLNEIVEMQLYSINSSFDSFSVDQTFEDLNVELINNYFDKLSNSGRIKLNNDAVSNLKQIGLIKQSKITFAASLLL